MSEYQNTVVDSTDATDAQTQVITPKFDQFSDAKTMKFNFRKDDLGNKRATVELIVPVPSVEGIVRILENGGKGLELLLDAVADVIASQARSIVDANEAITQETFDVTKVEWDVIANLPKAERRGGGIPKELWEAFSKDYIEIMPALTNKTSEQIANAAKILLNKFAAVKTNKPVLKLLKEQLALYVNNSTNADQYTDCVDFLVNKAEALLNMSDADMIANL